VLAPLLNFLKPDVPTELLRNVTWVLVNICRAHNPVISSHVVATLLPVILKLFLHADVSIVIDALWALSYILAGPSEHVDIAIAYEVRPFLFEFSRHHPMPAGFRSSHRS